MSGLLDELEDVFGMCGQYEHTVDAKGRMNFPAKLRDKLSEHFVISKTMGSKSLTVYTVESWKAIVECLKDKPADMALPIRRFIFGNAFEGELDKTGRMPIPQKLREYAGIVDEVVVVGMGDRAEIWDKKTWEEYENSFTVEQAAEFTKELR